MLVWLIAERLACADSYGTFEAERKRRRDLTLDIL